MAKKVTIETLAAQMRRFDKRLDTFVTLMVEGFENLNGKVDALQADMTEMKRDQIEVMETQEAHGKAIDKDAVTLINHETRLQNLEPVR